MQLRAHNPALPGATGTFDEADLVGDAQCRSLGDVERAHDLLELVDPTGPAAANDDRYVSHPVPVERHDSLAMGLVRGLFWWAFFVCVGIAAFAMVLR